MKSNSRRSTRSARGSAKRRGRQGRQDEGGPKSRLQKSAERGPARKWVQVMRPPASHIKFVVSTWVALADLTEAERQDYYEQERQQQQQREEALGETTQRAAATTTTTSESNDSMEMTTPVKDANDTPNASSEVASTQPPVPSGDSAAATSISSQSNSNLEPPVDPVTTAKRMRPEEEDTATTPESAEPSVKRVRIEIEEQESNPESVPQPESNQETPTLELTEPQQPATETNN
jgi:hypothetical protein